MSQIKTTPENPKNRTSAKVEGAIISGVSGAALGVSAAALYSTELSASESDPVIETEQPQAHVESASPVVTEIHHHVIDHHIINVAEEEVLMYQHIMDENGNHIADTAEICVAGRKIVYIDTNLDGKANLAWVDTDGDNVMGLHEIVNVSNVNINMNTLHTHAYEVTCASTDTFPIPGLLATAHPICNTFTDEDIAEADIDRDITKDGYHEDISIYETTDYNEKRPIETEGMPENSTYAIEESLESCTSSEIASEFPGLEDNAGMDDFMV